MNQSKSLGGRPGVTMDEVRAASLRLQEQGRFVGAVNVRLETGRGSYSTIQKHLRALGYVEAKPSGSKKT